MELFGEPPLLFFPPRSPVAAAVPSTRDFDDSVCLIDAFFFNTCNRKSEKFSPVKSTTAIYRRPCAPVEVFCCAVKSPPQRLPIKGNSHTTVFAARCRGREAPGRRIDRTSISLEWSLRRPLISDSAASYVFLVESCRMSSSPLALQALRKRSFVG